MNDPRETFQIECNELLSDMEDALLVLETVPNDFSQINAIFRAMHTIKGTSGVFGYDDIVSFTHVVENVLDRVRDGEIDMTGSLVEILLKSMDHTKILAHACINDIPLSDSDNKNEIILIEKLNTFLIAEDAADLSNVSLGNSLKNSLTIEEEVDENEVDDKSKKGIISEGSVNTVESPYWHISLRLDANVLENGMDPLSFFSYLNKMGEIKNLTTIDLNLPLDDSFNPEKNYLGFELIYDSKENHAKIEQTFEFVIDMCRLHIIAPHAMIKEYALLLAAFPENTDYLKQVLVKSGALSKIELTQLNDIEINNINEANELNEVKASAEQVSDELFDKTSEKIATKPVINSVTQSVTQSKEIITQDTILKSDLAVNETANAIVNTTTKSAVKQSRVVRVDADKLDSLINLVGELVIAEAATHMIASQLGDDKLLESISSIRRLVEGIRDNALNLRMVPVGDSFNRFKRVVRDVSKDLGKDIKLIIKGADTELDKTVIEKIGDPLMHIVRNAIDHGLETVDERVNNNKSPQGSLTLAAYHDAGCIVIDVNDDGRGLNKERILSKAIEKGLINANHALTDQEIYQLVFAAGFSTAEAVTNLSGRGVGMDVVKKNIEALRGTVDIYSTAGKGSTVSIRLPLTLAIIDGFLVKVGQSSYVIPLDMVFECIDLSENNNLKHTCDKTQGHITLRGEILPFIQLKKYFNESGPEPKHKSIVVVRFGNRKAGFVVDELLGELQTVIKPMGKILNNIKGLSGATILGSGEVAVILDVPNLIKRVIQSIDADIEMNKIKRSQAGQQNEHRNVH